MSSRSMMTEDELEGSIALSRKNQVEAAKKAMQENRESRLSTEASRLSTDKWAKFIVDIEEDKIKQDKEDIAAIRGGTPRRKSPPAASASGTTRRASPASAVPSGNGGPTPMNIG